MGCAISLLAALLLQAAPPAPAEPAPVAAPWTRVRFEARKGLLHGDVVMTLRSATADEVRARLMAWPEGAAREPMGEVQVFETRTKATFRAEVRRTTWIDDAGVLQDETIEGKRRSLRRFGTDGAHQWKERLTDGGPSAREEKQLTWPLPTDGRPIWDVAALIHAATVQRLQVRDAPLEFAIVTKGRRVAVEAVPGPLVELEVDGARGCTKVAARRIDVRPSTEDDEESVAVLGMRGDVQLFVDAVTGRPLEVRGTVPHVGLIRARVVEIE
jgi:hypothetical protein